MKNFRTFAVTLGIGSAVAWLASNRKRRVKLIEKGREFIQNITGDSTNGDDNDIRYI